MDSLLGPGGTIGRLVESPDSLAKPSTLEQVTNSDHRARNARGKAGKILTYIFYSITTGEMLYVQACGGSISGPVQPPPTTKTGTVVVDSYVGIGDPNLKLVGATADISGIQSVVGDNGVTLFNIPTGNRTLKFLDFGNAYERSLGVVVNEGTNKFVTINGAENTINKVTYSMDDFSTIARNNSGLRGEGAGIKDGTVKWAQKPTVYVDVTSIGILKLKDIFPLIETTITKYLGQLSDGFLSYSKADIQYVLNSADLPKDGKLGAFILRGDPNETSASAISFMYVNKANNITSFTAVYTDGVYNKAVVAEAGKGVGFPVDYAKNTGPSDSVINVWSYADIPRPIDIVFGELLYRMPAGTKNPYDTTGLGFIQGLLTTGQSTSQTNGLSDEYNGTSTPPEFGLRNPADQRFRGPTERDPNYIPDKRQELRQQKPGR